MKECKECKKEIAKDSSFCSHCGSKVNILSDNECGLEEIMKKMTFEERLKFCEKNNKEEFEALKKIVKKCKGKKEFKKLLREHIIPYSNAVAKTKHSIFLGAYYVVHDPLKKYS